jgi:hypothetical protein
MHARRVTYGITAIATILALLVPTAAFAAPPATVHPPEFVGTYNYIWTTYDNGMGGLWATDFFNSQVSIWKLGFGLYRVVFVDGGTFETLDADSPGDPSLPVAAGITGNISGGVSIIVSGFLRHGLPSMVGPMDFRSGGGWTNYLSPFFWFPRVLEWEQWGWSHNSCGNGTWVDNEETEEAYAEEGPNALMGNISGDPVPCAAPANPVVLNLWGYINPGATDEAARGNICYILSLTQPTQSEENNDVRRLCFTESSPDWWQGAVLLAHGAVYDDGSDFGLWQGDAAAQAFSSAKRLPLHATGPHNDLVELAEVVHWTQ